MRFRRPTARRKSSAEGIALNLVPILDTLVTLIAFVLFTMSALSLVSIEAPVPRVEPSEQTELLRERPLQLTLSVFEDRVEVWSPFERVALRRLRNLRPGEVDIASLSRVLVEIKQRFPNEKRVVLVPEGSIPYERLLQIMDAARYVSVPQRAPQPLFPELVFGNLLGKGGSG